MEPSSEWAIRRFESGQATSAVDVVINEMRIELDVNNGQVSLAMLCLPRDLEALAVGFLLGEGALRSIEDLQRVEYSPDESKVFIEGDFDADVLENMSLRWTWGSGCGGGGTSRDVNDGAYARLPGGPEISPLRIEELTKQFRRRAELWRLTGCVHGCALADTEKLLVFAEDVGRHNAFDKVVGMAAFDKIPLAGKIVITTGRLSAEIVSKAVASGVAILVSRSAVTNLAVRLARRFGLTLVGFARGRRLNVYTGYERIQ